MSTTETPQPEPTRPTLKELARKYKTPVACAATAAGTYFLTRNVMLQAGKTVFTSLGQQHALDVVQRDVLLEFVNEKDLVEEFGKYIESIGKK